MVLLFIGVLAAPLTQGNSSLPIDVRADMFLGGEKSFWLDSIINWKSLSMFIAGTALDVS